MATVHVDFPPDPMQSDDALDCNPPLPFHPFKVSDYTELGGALDLQVHPSNENVQPSSQFHAMTDWFATPTSYRPGQGTLPTTPASPIGFEEPTPQFDIPLQARLDSFGALLYCPPNTPHCGSFDIRYLPEMMISPFICATQPSHDNFRSLLHDSYVYSSDNQVSRRWNGDRRVYEDVVPSNAQSFSSPSSGISERTFEVDQPPRSGSVAGLPASTAHFLTLTDGNTLRSIPPSDGDICNDKHPPPDRNTYNYSPVPPDGDADNDTPVSPDAGAYNDTSIPSDTDAYNDTPIQSDGDAYSDTLVQSDEDAYGDTPPPSYGDIHNDARSSTPTDENALGDIPPPDGDNIHHDTPPGGDPPHEITSPDEPVFSGPIGNYIQNNQNGTSECLWVSGDGLPCKFVSRWELVKRHIKRTHYHER